MGKGGRRHEPLSDRAVFLGLPVYSADEVASHCTDGDLWMSAHGRVYNVTPLFASAAHPGGVKALLTHGGCDCTRDFDFHSSAGQRDWAQYQIGWIADSEPCSLLGIAMWALSRRLRTPAAA
jgi:hypothetical protein